MTIYLHLLQKAMFWQWETTHTVNAPTIANKEQHSLLLPKEESPFLSKLYLLLYAAPFKENKKVGSRGTALFGSR